MFCLSALSVCVTSVIISKLYFWLCSLEILTILSFVLALPNSLAMFLINEEM